MINIGSQPWIIDPIEDFEKPTQLHPTSAKLSSIPINKNYLQNFHKIKQKMIPIPLKVQVNRQRLQSGHSKANPIRSDDLFVEFSSHVINNLNAQFF